MDSELDIQITYRAIIDAACGKGFITYSEIATQHGATIGDARAPLIGHLNKLLKICFKNEWPAMPVIVVAAGTEELTDNHLEAFIKSARRVGWIFANDQEFADEQRQKLIEWAPRAPHTLEVEESLDEPDYWVVGFHHGDDSQKDRFLEEGIWENGDDGKKEEEVRKVRVGDLLIMKSTFTQTNSLPFENNGKPVSAMRITATGTVTKSNLDGRKIEVDWDPLPTPKDWYFFVYRMRIQKMNTSNRGAQELIKFAFEGKEQDFDYWLNEDWVKEKGYGIPDAAFDSALIDGDDSVDRKKSEKRPYGIRDIVNDGCFAREEDLSDALSQLRSKKNLILQGPPGTGKTWLAKRLANALIGTDSEDAVSDQVRRIQFHPSLSYEDFVRGWRPRSDGKLDLVDGAFLKAVNAASANIDSDHVVIVDEINRGNTAQIFGEMLTLIESDKRNESEAIEIAYPRHDGERIHVPDNLHIIGTMNIADRSLAIVDLALRRRFAFMSLEPVFDDLWIEWCVEKAGFDQNVVGRVGSALGILNDQIANDRSLGAQYRIGHSYVTPSPDDVAGDGKEWFRHAIMSGIDPLLHEYWFENHDTAQEHVDKLLESIQ